MKEKIQVWCKDCDNIQYEDFEGNPLVWTCKNCGKRHEWELRPIKKQK